VIPVPESRIVQFEKLAFGMFVHWGLYSQLGRGEWIKRFENIPMSDYAKLKDTFTADECDPAAWVGIAKEAGMKYICLTTRHHEGFSLYDTRGLSDFDAVHSPAHRDIVAEFVKACRSEDITPFFYHTTLDWYNETFETDFDTYLEYLRRSIEILCTNYGHIGGFWFDGNWSKPNADWKEDQLYATIRKHQPDAIIVNNTGLFALGKQGHPEIDSVTYEQGRPEPLNREGMKKYIAAEMCQTMNQHWGIATNDLHYLSPKDCIETLCACRKLGANYLLNIGPTASGRIPDYEASVLRRVGQWVKIGDKVIREGKPCKIKAYNSDFALQTDDAVYLFIHHLTINGCDHVTVTGDGGGAGPRAFDGINKKVISAKWLDNNESLRFSQSADGLFCLSATGFPYGSDLVVRIAELRYR